MDRSYSICMNSPLQPLMDILSTLEFEEFGQLMLSAATWAAKDVTLHLTVLQQGKQEQAWRLHCQGVRNSRIVNGQSIDTVAVKTRHPLLLPHTEAVVDLYFSSPPADADGTIGRLIEAHRAVVGGWFDCLHFFNLGSHHSLRAMLNGGFGRLAIGPRPLINSYADVLRASGVAVSSLPSRSPVWWDGERWIEEVGPLFAIILDESFVVASAVTAQRG